MSEARHPIRVLAEEAWEAVSRSDIDTLRQLWHPDLVWHARGPTPWAGDHQGVDAILDFLAGIGELTEIFDASLEDLLVSDERVLLLFHVRMARGIHREEFDYQLLGRVIDERVVEIWTAPLDPAALAAFWREELEHGVS